MRSKYGIGIRSGILTILAVALLAVSASGYSQTSPLKPTRQSALDAFAKEDFETALSDFNYLITLYPKDPLYKYYSGVCLVKLERDPQKASQFLTESVSAASGIRSVPADGQFWLGRALQMSGEFDKAVEAYNSYSAVAGKKNARELGVPEYVQQSQNGKGMIVSSAVVTRAIGKPEEITAPAVKKPEEEISVVKADKPAVIPVPLPRGDDHLLEMALSFRRSSDSLAALASGTRAKMAAAPSAERESMMKRAEKLEVMSVASRDSADRYMALFMKKPVDIPPVEVKQAETTQTVAVKAAKAAPAAAVAVFSSFDVVAISAKDKDEQVKVKVEIPAGLVYRIQLAVFRNPVAVSYFKGITPITGVKNPASGITTYFGGLFRRSSDASKALTRVKSLGFRDAFVAAHMDNKQVSAERAAYLEKEWGSKPLYEVVPASSATADTVPPTLVLRVEIIRSSKPITADKLDEIKKLSGTRGMDILVNDSKQNIYLIGIFLTYKSATEYADLLIRNGYRDAKVVAYLGQREIPVETARQLFEQE